MLEITDIIDMSEAVATNQKSVQSLFDRYSADKRNTDNDHDYKTRLLLVWDHMWKNKYIPEHLGSDDDLETASDLTLLTEIIHSPMPLAASIIMLHRRMMLGDSLEKAFAAEELVRILFRHEEMTKKLIVLFILCCKGSPRFSTPFDETDWNMGTLDGKEWYTAPDLQPCQQKPRQSLCLELVRSTLPALKWLADYNPSAGQDSPVPQWLIPLLEEKENVSIPIRKLTLFASFLNTLFHQSDKLFRDGEFDWNAAVKNS